MSVKFREWLDSRHISHGIGNREECCSIACVNLFHRGVMDDATPKGMSKVLAIWIIIVQDTIPDEMRNSSEWKDLLSKYVETTDREDGVRRTILEKWILEVVVPEYKPYMSEEAWKELQECNLDAWKHGFGGLYDSFEAIRLGGIVSTVMRAFTGLIYGPYKGDFSGFKIYDTFNQLLAAVS